VVSSALSGFSDGVEQLSRARVSCCASSSATESLVSPAWTKSGLSPSATSDFFFLGELLFLAWMVEGRNHTGGRHTTQATAQTRRSQMRGEEGALSKARSRCA
jgi:hypothetical protein